MAQTTKTALQLCNEALLQIGERSVSNFGTAVAQKAKAALDEAITEICYLDDWSWMRHKVVALAWSGTTATLSNRTVRVFSVAYDSMINGSYYELKYLERTAFDAQPTTPGRPRYWTMLDNDDIGIKPYPDNTDDQTSIKFYVSQTIPLPRNPGDTLEMPDRYLPLLMKRVMYHLATRHLDDAGYANRLSEEYQLLFRRLRNLERRRGVGTMSMYRRR